MRRQILVVLCLAVTIVAQECQALSGRCLSTMQDGHLEATFGQAEFRANVYPNLCFCQKNAACDTSTVCFPAPSDRTLRLQQSTLLYMGSPPAPRDLRAQSTPLCASNGVTYLNYFYFTVAMRINPSLRKLFDGKCKSVASPPTWGCDPYSGPVCGYLVGGLPGPFASECDCRTVLHYQLGANYRTNACKMCGFAPRADVMVSSTSMEANSSSDAWTLTTNATTEATRPHPRVHKRIDCQNDAPSTSLAPSTASRALYSAVVLSLVLVVLQ